MGAVCKKPARPNKMRFVQARRVHEGFTCIANKICGRPRRFPQLLRDRVLGRWSADLSRSFVEIMNETVTEDLMFIKLGIQEIGFPANLASLHQLRFKRWVGRTPFSAGEE